MAGFVKRVHERLINFVIIPQIELDGMEVVELWEAVGIARCSPYFMTRGKQCLRSG